MSIELIFNVAMTVASYQPKIQPMAFPLPIKMHTLEQEEPRSNDEILQDFEMLPEDDIHKSEIYDPNLA